jgi:hypothetical protein
LLGEESPNVDTFEHTKAPQDITKMTTNAHLHPPSPREKY